MKQRYSSILKLGTGWR